MQDNIRIPPRPQLDWLRKVLRYLSAYNTRNPMIITGYRMSYYRVHDWFWACRFGRIVNDNIPQSH